VITGGRISEGGKQPQQQQQGCLYLLAKTEFRSHLASCRSYGYSYPCCCYCLFFKLTEGICEDCVREFEVHEIISDLDGREFQTFGLVHSTEDHI
jgi:hypothetical protein